IILSHAFRLAKLISTGVSSNWRSVISADYSVIPAFHGLESAAARIVDDSRDFGALRVEDTFEARHQIIGGSRRLPFQRIQAKFPRRWIELPVQTVGICLVAGARW